MILLFPLIKSCNQKKRKDKTEQNNKSIQIDQSEEVVTRRTVSRTP